MEEILISKSVLDNLNPISYEHERVCKLNINNESKILKKLYFNKSLNDDVIYTIKALNESKSLFSSEFVIPDHLVRCNNKLVGFTLKEVVGSVSLEKILNSKISHKEKINYLKKIGFLLEKTNEIRKSFSFIIGDLHEENILVKDSNIYIIDLDSAKVNDNLVKPSKYLSTCSLADNVSKYKKNDDGFIIPTRDTEIYSYIVIILNYILKKDIAYYSIPEYLNMLDYLDDRHFDKELISCFFQIILSGSNRNPLYLLDTIEENKLRKIKFYK